MGSPDGSLPDLEGTGYRTSTMEEEINEMFVQIAKLPLLTQSVSRLDKCVQTLSHTVASYDAKITNIEQMVSSLAARVTTLETNATTVSSDLARQDLGTCLDRVPAPQPLGPSVPMALGHPMTTGIQDADLILPQALLMNTREVPSYYDSLANNTTKGSQSASILFGKNPTCQPTRDLSQFIVKQVPRRSGLYLRHEPNVKTLLSDFKMMASPMRLTVPFAASKQLLLSANPNQLKTERLENNLHLCGGVQTCPSWKRANICPCFT